MSRAEDYYDDALVVRLSLEAAAKTLHIARNAAGLGEKQGRKIQELLMAVLDEGEQNEVLLAQLSKQMLFDHETDLAKT